MNKNSNFQFGKSRTKSIPFWICGIDASVGSQSVGYFRLGICFIGKKQFPNKAKK
jgi:hypothetical protein